MTPRILLITPSFYDLEKNLIEGIENLGFEVVWIENTTIAFDYHGTGSAFRFIRRIYFFLFFPHVRYIRGELNRIMDIRFDVLFSVNANVICRYLLKRLKHINPDIFSILYLWDSTKMYDWRKEARLFDKVLTFDKEDSAKYGFGYKPNFFIDGERQYHYKTEYDLYYAGKYDPSRIVIIDKILDQIKGSDIKVCLHVWPAYRKFLHNHFLYRLLKSIRARSRRVKDYLLYYEALEGILEREYIISNKMSFEENHEYLMRSNVILDLPFQGQSGYSHRVIGALAAGKKIITTNSKLDKENFIDRRQIRFIEPDDPHVDIEWIKRREKFTSDAVVLKLELSEWLKSILDVAVA